MAITNDFEKANVNDNPDPETVMSKPYVARKPWTVHINEEKDEGK